MKDYWKATTQAQRQRRVRGTGGGMSLSQWINLDSRMALRTNLSHGAGKILIRFTIIFIQLVTMLVDGIGEPI